MTSPVSSPSSRSAWVSRLTRPLSSAHVSSVNSSMIAGSSPFFSAMSRRPTAMASPQDQRRRRASAAAVGQSLHERGHFEGGDGRIDAPVVGAGFGTGQRLLERVGGEDAED